jgi:hypothetical protein
MPAGTNVAFANELEMVDSDASGNITMTFNVLVTGPSIDLQSIAVPVTVAPGQSQATILTNITSAIVTACTGIGVTVARSAIFIQSYQRGQ